MSSRNPPLLLGLLTPCKAFYLILLTSLNGCFYSNVLYALCELCTLFLLLLYYLFFRTALWSAAVVLKRFANVGFIIICDLVGFHHIFCCAFWIDTLKWWMGTVKFLKNHKSTERLYKKVFWFFFFALFHKPLMWTMENRNRCVE